MMMKRIVVPPKKSLRFRTYYNHAAVRREFFGSGASEEPVRSKVTYGPQLTAVDGKVGPLWFPSTHWLKKSWSALPKA